MPIGSSASTRNRVDGLHQRVAGPQRARQQLQRVGQLARELPPPCAGEEVEHGQGAEAEHDEGGEPTNQLSHDRARRHEHGGDRDPEEQELGRPQGQVGLLELALDAVEDAAVARHSSGRLDGTAHEGRLGQDALAGVVVALVVGVALVAVRTQGAFEHRRVTDHQHHDGDAGQAGCEQHEQGDDPLARRAGEHARHLHLIEHLRLFGAGVARYASHRGGGLGLQTAGGQGEVDDTVGGLRRVADLVLVLQGALGLGVDLGQGAGLTGLGVLATRGVGQALEGAGIEVGATLQADANTDALAACTAARAWAPLVFCDTVSLPSESSTRLGCRSGRSLNSPAA